MPKKIINASSHNSYLCQSTLEDACSIYALDPASKIIQAMAEFTCHNLNGSIEWAINKLFCDCEYRLYKNWINT